jgi:hypothetical protein
MAIVLKKASDLRTCVLVVLAPLFLLAICSGCTAFKAPDAPTVTPGEGEYELTVSWAAIDGASSYEIWGGSCK